MVIARGSEVCVVSQDVPMKRDRSRAFVKRSHEDGKTFGQPTHAIPNILGFATVGPRLFQQNCVDGGTDGYCGPACLTTVTTICEGYWFE